MAILESVHGGHNNYAVGVHNGIYKEEEQADWLAYRVAQLTGARYIKQDKGNVQQNLDYFVREMDKKRGVNLSIHFNGFNKKATGTESFSYPNDRLGITISTNMSKKVANVIGIVDRGNKHAHLYVINNSIDTTTLLEVCFLDNDSDIEKYMAKREEVAHAIASCYDNYIGEEVKPVKPKPIVYQDTPGLYEALKTDNVYHDVDLKKKSSLKIVKGQRIHLEDVIKRGKYTRTKIRINNDVRYITMRDDYWKLIKKTKAKKIK